MLRGLVYYLDVTKLVLIVSSNYTLLNQPTMSLVKY